MDCEKIKDRLLTVYPDKELNARENAEVESHLVACAGCREFHGALQKAAVIPFKEAGEMQPDEVVWRRIQEQIEAERQKAGGWFGQLADLLAPVLKMPQPAFRVAFVTALVLVVVVLARWPSGTIEPAYAYVEEQMTFMEELGTGNTELLNGELKDYDTALEEMIR